MNAWTQQELAFITTRLDMATVHIFDAFQEEFTFTERTYNSVQKKVKALRDIRDIEECDETGTWEPPEETTLDPVIYIDESEHKERRVANKDAVQNWLEGFAELAADIRPTVPHVANSEKTSLVLLLSDNHFGKQTAVFDLQVARSRVCSIPEKLRERALPELDEIVVLLAGDLVEGEDIYPTQASEIECSVLDQVQAATRALWDMLLNLTDVFPDCLIRVETCPGNHGRISKTANPKSNWDNVVYRQLGLLHSMAVKYNDKIEERISIDVNCNPFRHVHIKDKWGLIYHQGVKHTGTPAMQNKLNGWAEGMPHDFIAHGHWHKWEIGTQHGRAIIKNGSLSGPDSLSLSMGVYDPPRQAYFFITPNKGLWGFSYLEW